MTNMNFKARPFTTACRPTVSSVFERDHLKNLTRLLGDTSTMAADKALFLKQKAAIYSLLR